MSQRDEAARALSQLKVHEALPSELLDDVADIARRLFNAPIVAINFADTHQVLIKSRTGITFDRMPRAHVFTDHAIRSRQLLVVEDTATDPRFANHPLVVGSTRIRFVAAAPLMTYDGDVIGTLSVADCKARSFSRTDRRLLGKLARMIVTDLELLQTAGRRDVVTGLPNWPQLIEDLDALAQARPGQPATGIVIDLAPLPLINDGLRALGMSHIDEIAHHKAAHLLDLLGDRARLYHVRLSRFVLVLTGDTAWETVVEEIVDGLRSPTLAGTLPVTFPACAGVLPFRLGEISPDAMFRMALNAAHEARNMHVPWKLHDPGLDQAQQRRYRLLSDMPAACEAVGQLHLAFQPKIDIRTRRCVGAEALLRWNHPEFGLVSPGEFIPLVEKTIMASRMTEWVIDAALEEVRVWRDAGLDLSVSVNVTARNLAEPDFARQIIAALHRRNLSSRVLELEFTEGSLLENTNLALEQLRQVGAAGVQIAIDDFGTGYCNFSYLRQVPASVLKLDQSFIRSLPTSVIDQVIVRSMISMAHDLGYRVIAEGVERLEILELVTSLGADEAQGYYLARPLPAAEFRAWVARCGNCTPAGTRPGRINVASAPLPVALAG